MPDAVLIAVGALILSAMLTAAMRWLALSHGLLDIPNDRSSHRAVTPRGGGLAVVVTTTAALAALAALGLADRALWPALIGGGTAVALVGFLDDRGGVSVGLRLGVHAVAAVWAVYCAGGLPPLPFGHRLVSLGWGGDVLAVGAVMWTLNLFNFMDGIDGIAASEAVFVALGGTTLGIVAGSASQVGLAALALAAACAGFLWWNWPPAKIFLGDVGSGYLGYVIAVLALAAGHEHASALWAWLILGGAFFVDATVTLLRRLRRRERVYQAHRTHAYQWLARRWGSHARVTGAVLVLDVLWLFPCALLATLRPADAALATCVALAPLVVLVISAGAGRSERPPGAS